MEVLGWIFLILIILVIIRSIAPKRVSDAEASRKKLLFNTSVKSVASNLRLNRAPSWSSDQKRLDDFLHRVFYVAHKRHGLPQMLPREGLLCLMKVVASSAATVEDIGGSERDQEAFAVSMIQYIIIKRGVEIFEEMFDVEYYAAVLDDISSELS